MASDTDDLKIFRVFLQCGVTYGIKSDGSCAQCIDRYNCYECDGDNPSKCLECRPLYGRTSQGTCVPCPLHCLSCKSGKCSKVRLIFIISKVFNIMHELGRWIVLNKG